MISFLKKIATIFFIFLMIIVGYNFWSNTNRATSTEDMYPRYVIGDVQQVGINHGKGNILALSPYVHTYNFSSKEAFHNMLHYHLDFAKRRNFLNDSTIVVLPEYIGTWLVVANEKNSVYVDTSITDAMKTIVLSNLGRFGKYYLTSTAQEKTKETIFKMKAANMLDIYQSTCSKLAKEFHVTIVAGSVVLPNPSVKNNKIEIEPNGKLYNITAVFDHNGSVLAPLTKKIFPIEEEKTFTCAANTNEIPVYKINDKNLAVLICADAWYPESYTYLQNNSVDILVVPSFVAGNNTWKTKWKGYNGAATPIDVEKTDIGKISEHDAWLKYAMMNRTLKSDIKTGVNVFLRGDLWNLGSDGNTLVTTTEYFKPLNIPEVFEGTNKIDKSGSLINIWLP